MDCGVQQYNLCINQGATYARVFTWFAGNCGDPTSCCAPGTTPTSTSSTTVPVNLTGYTASMQIRQFALSPTVLYDASNDIVLGGVFGTITLTIDATDTEGFTWWQGVYDLLLTSSGGQVTRLLTGSVTVSQGITQ